jgi:hypothetical protein
VRRTTRAGRCGPGAEPRPARLVFAHQVTQLLFATRRREDHIAYAAIGLPNRGLGDAKEHCCLARHALQIIQQLLLDTLLGAHTNFVDGLDEEIDQAVCHLTPAQPAQRGNQRGAQRRRVGPQFVRGFDRGTLAKSLDNFQ